MGKKYIVNPPENPKYIFEVCVDAKGDVEVYGDKIENFTQYTEPDLERIKQKSYDKGYSNGHQDGYKQGMNDYLNTPNLEQVKREAYREGREDGIHDGMCDAWEVARKIGCGTAQGGFSPEMMRNVFGTSCYSSNVFHELTASEAITKIKEYEEGKQRIKVWDEIYCVGRPDIKVCVTDVEDGNFSGFTVEHPDNSNIGHVYSCRSFDGWEKTGRCFAEIGTVLNKMRGEQDKE